MATTASKSAYTAEHASGSLRNDELGAESSGAGSGGPWRTSKTKMSMSTVVELEEIQVLSEQRPIVGATEVSGIVSPSSNTDQVTSRDVLAEPPVDQVYAEVTHTFTYPYMNRWRVLSCGIGCFTQGMIDSATGALLPYMEQQYHVSYELVSLIFVCQAIGFITAAVIAHWLLEKFGRAKVYSSFATLNALCFVALACAPPFPVLLVAFLLSGVGNGLILALSNVFIVNLHNGTVNLSYMHGLYGIGGVIAPFISTLMVSSGVRWSFFYLLPMSSIAVGAGLFGWSFRGYESETAVLQLPRRRESLDRVSSRGSTAGGGGGGGGGVWKKALKKRATLLGAVFIFAYQGAEVCISGWIISFLIDYRNGDPAKVGYVTSGFWGGITLSRFVLAQLMYKIGVRVSVAVVVAATAALQLLVWLIPNVVSNAVVVGVLGVLLGPLYACSTGIFTKLIPSDLHVSSLSFISSMGMTGGASAPLLTGLLAQTLGTVVLNPVCIVLYGFMEVAWLTLPKISKRSD